MTAPDPGVRQVNHIIFSWIIPLSTEHPLVLLRIPIGFHLTLTEVVVLIPHFV
jgi:hypothetical protein